MFQKTLLVLKPKRWQRTVFYRIASKRKAGEVKRIFFSKPLGHHRMFVYRLRKGKTFRDAFLEDFQAIRKEGIDHPDIDKIIALLRKG